MRIKTEKFSVKIFDIFKGLLVSTKATFGRGSREQTGRRGESRKNKLYQVVKTCS